MYSNMVRNEGFCRVKSLCTFRLSFFVFLVLALISAFLKILISYLMMRLINDRMVGAS